MTPNDFGRAIAAYPMLLRAAFGHEPVTIAPDEALALLTLFDAVTELAKGESRIAQGQIVLHDSEPSPAARSKSRPLIASAARLADEIERTRRLRRAG